MAQVDTSIYNIKPVPMPSVAEAAQSALTMSQLAAQTRQAKVQNRELQENEAIREAFGRFHQGGDRKTLLSDLAKTNPAKAMEFESAMLKQDEEKQKAHLQRAQIFGSSLESIAGMSPAERAANYPKLRASLVQSGVIQPGDAPEEYDDTFYQGNLMKYRQTKDYLERAQASLGLQKTQAEIGKIYAETGKTKSEQMLAGTPRAKLDKAGGEVKQKIGHLTSGLQALTKYENTFRNGGRQAYIDSSTPLIGNFVASTPIDEARTSVEEAIGRLASGGAINRDEEARFRRMLPRAADSDDDAARKLLDLRRDMESKLAVYGFKTEDLGGLGLNEQDLGYGTEHALAEGRGLIQKKTDGIIPAAVADETPKAPRAPAAPPKPKPGHIEDGYVFMGGDEANPKSWKKAR